MDSNVTFFLHRPRKYEIYFKIHQYSLLHATLHIRIHQWHIFDHKKRITEVMRHQKISTGILIDFANLFFFLQSGSKSYALPMSHPRKWGMHNKWFVWYGMPDSETEW